MMLPFLGYLYARSPVVRSEDCRGIRGRCLSWLESPILYEIGAHRRSGAIPRAE